MNTLLPLKKLNTSSSFTQATKRLFSSTSNNQGGVGATKTPAKRDFNWECGKYDQSQILQMQDMMTLVDENDRVLGPISKLDGHLLNHEKVQYHDNKKVHRSELHRAFSLLLFNSKNELLL